ncbi:MAG: nitroreductase [Candidatus Margulisiibacteriota bacterium]|jgi:nitroreductase
MCNEQVFKVIKSRRAVRKYLDKPVSRELIEQILEAGQLAPSGMNSQPWRFVVVRDPVLRKELAVAARKKAEPFYEEMFQKFPERRPLIEQRFATMTDPIYYSAPVVIFLICEGRFAATSAGLAAENMFLAAKALGLGSIWVDAGRFGLEDEAIKTKFGIKGTEEIIAPLLFGYADEEPELPPRKELAVKWF